MMEAETVVIIPVADLADAKTRLSEVMDPGERRRLTETSLRHVLRQTSNVDGIDRVLVVSPSPELRGLTTKHRAEFLRESKPYAINSAVRQAEQKLQREQYNTTVVLPADLPYLKPRHLEESLELRSKGAQLVLMPSHDGGTNLLLRSPPTVVQPSFGPGSYFRHLEEAESMGIPHQVLDSFALSIDLDTPSDLAFVLADHRETPVKDALTEMGLSVEEQGDERRLLRTASR